MKQLSGAGDNCKDTLSDKCQKQFSKNKLGLMRKQRETQSVYLVWSEALNLEKSQQFFRQIQLQQFCFDESADSSDDVLSLFLSKPFTKSRG